MKHAIHVVNTKEKHPYHAIVDYRWRVLEDSIRIGVLKHLQDTVFNYIAILVVFKLEENDVDQLDRLKDRYLPALDQCIDRWPDILD